SVLYALCTGQAPFHGSTSLGVVGKVRKDEPQPISELNPQIPDWLCALIGKLHAKDPVDRIQSAAEVAGLLEERLARLRQPLALPEATSTSGAGEARSARASRRTRQVLWTGAVLLFLLASGVTLTEATG